MKKPPHKIKKKWLSFAFGNSSWDAGNQFLNDLCKRYPGHANEDHVLAKIWLIGRAYSASVERGASGEGNSEKYLIKLSKQIKTSNIDKTLSKLPAHSLKFTQHIEQIVEAHHHIERLFSKGIDIRRVSFTSKYLHFHRPDLFPIYDSRVASAITKVTPDRRHAGINLPAKYVDTLYGKYCVRVAWLASKMEEMTDNYPTPRQVDNLLLEIDREFKRKKKSK